MATFTLKDLVWAINHTDKGREATEMSRTFQHWTNSQVLTPDLPWFHQGTGRHRQYQLNQLYVAGIRIPPPWILIAFRRESRIIV